MWRSDGKVVRANRMLFAALATVVVAAPAFAANRAPRWSRTYAEAQQIRAEADCPLVVFVTMPGCVFCDKMMDQTLHHPSVGRRFRHDAVLAIVRTDQNRPLVQQFAPRVFPTTYVITADNRIAKKLEGFIPPEQLVHELNEARRVSPRHSR